MVTTAIAAAVLLLLTGCQDDYCRHTYDGVCDEGTLCLVGTDTADCEAAGHELGPNSCEYAFDGTCDEGTLFCRHGTDTADCDSPTSVGPVCDTNDYWKGPGDTTIQITAFCGQACNYANVFGPDSSEVNQTCGIMFAAYTVPSGWCPVCDPHRP